MAYFIWQIIFAASCLTRIYGNDMDTYGREFVFLYPPNNSGSSKMNASLSIINPNIKHSANVTVKYPEFRTTGKTITAVPRVTTLVIKVLSSVLHKFNKSVILDSIKYGLHSYVDARIVVHSDIPVSLIAHNVDITGALDSFLVLPTSMAGNHYAFTLPSPSSSGSINVYFLPIKVELHQYITVDVIREASSSSCKYTAKLNNMLAFSSSGESITFYAHSNLSFVIVAAVRSLPKSKEPNTFDFGCFMPSSLPTTNLFKKDCNELTVEENYIVPLFTGMYHMFTPVSAECKSVKITISGSNKVVQTKYLTSSSNPMRFDGYGNLAAISTTTILNIIHYGGYNIGTINYEEGGYLHEIPASSQFISGMLPFIVPSDSNQIIVIADQEAMSTAFFDGEIGLSFALLPFLNETLYYASGTVSSGFHFFYADGLYIIFIHGSTNNSAYGFVPAFMIQKVAKIDSATKFSSKSLNESIDEKQRTTTTTTLSTTKFPISTSTSETKPTTRSPCIYYTPKILSIEKFRSLISSSCISMNYQIIFYYIVYQCTHMLTF